MTFDVEKVIPYQKDADMERVTLVTDDLTPIDTVRMREEIGKILFSARLLRIKSHYVPQKGWASDHLAFPLPETAWMPDIRVVHQALLGTLLFKCQETEFEKIYIPGINAIYTNYRESRPASQNITDQNGMVTMRIIGYPVYVVLPPPREIIFP